MGCGGLHCDGCGHGKGGPAAAVIALLALIALALHKVWPQIVSALEIAAWTVAGITGAATAITITITVLTVRAVRRHRARLAARQAATIYRPGLIIAPGESGDRTIPFAQRPAIGQPRQRPARTWPLPAGWEAGRPLPSRDDDDHWAR